MRLLVAVLTLAHTAPLAAEPYQHGNVIFDLPAGWSVGGVDDLGTLTILSDLPDDECEFCYVYIAAGEKVAGRADSWLQTNAGRFVDTDDIDPPVVAPMGSAQIFNLKGRPGAMLGQTVDSDLQMLISVQLFGRMELFGFEMPASDEDQLAAHTSVFTRDIMPMIESARFVSEGAKPLLPDPVPGPLNGIYWGFSTGWTLGFDGMMQMDIDNRFLSFWPGGRFYDGTPPNGTKDFDPAERLQAGDPDWGSYTVKGNTLTLHFVTGRVEDLALTGDGIDDDGTAMSALDLVPDGTRLSGSTNDFFYSGFMPGAGVTGGVSTNSNVLYRQDGTFLHEHSASAAGNFESGGDLTGGYATNSENATEGSYEIRDGLIVLTAEGKEYRRHLVYRLGSDIYVGETILDPPQ
jgi:hypothetical protein